MIATTMGAAMNSPLRAASLVLVAVIAVSCDTANSPEGPTQRQSQTPAPPEPVPPAPPNSTFDVTGVVRDQSTGRGIPQAQIEIVQGINLGRSGATDASGTFRLDRLDGGAMRLRVTAADYTAYEIDVPLSGNLSLNFELAPIPMYTYSGIVTDSLGNPVAGVLVRGGPDSGVTDTSGRYTFRSPYPSVPGWLRPPDGFERKPIDPTATFPLVPGLNLTVRRISGVTISPPPTVTEGAGRVSVNARVAFDTAGRGAVRRLVRHDVERR